MEKKEPFSVSTHSPFEDYVAQLDIIDLNLMLLSPNKKRDNVYIHKNINVIWYLIGSEGGWIPYPPDLQ